MINNDRGQSLISKYVWVIETIYRRRKISFKELNERWLRDTDISRGVDIPKRTFDNWRYVIWDMFGISIVNENRGEYRYYIENEEDISKNGLRSWLYNTFCVSNVLANSQSIKDRIILEYVPSGQHSHYSILNGCSTIQQIVDSAIKNRMPGIAITDYGNMFGIMEFIEYVARINKERQEKGKKAFKPIIGCELYVTKHGSREQKNGVKDMKGCHLTVLAKNMNGYKNLIKIVSNAWTEGFYAAPRTDRYDLEKYHEGLIVLSGGWGSEVFTHAMKENMTALDDTIKWYKQVFGGDYYLEIRRDADYDLSKDSPSDLMIEQEKVNQVLIQKSKEYTVKVVATNDVHYVNPENLAVYNIQQCILVGKTMEEFDTAPLRFRWLTSKKFMTELFSDYPEAISNTMEIFDKVETYDIHHAPIMPPVSIPEGFKNDTDYLEHLTYTKAKVIYGVPLPEEVDDRLQFELEIIKKNGAERYFLFIQDVVNYAEKELGALVGPGRGSAAGSQVAYCLGITKIEPLKHDLLFERFMCPDRQMLPDIDLDFDEDGRSRVIEWLEKKYGKDYCAHIISYSTFSTRTAFSSVAQVKQLPAETANAIHQAIPVYFPYYPRQWIMPSSILQN